MENYNFLNPSCHITGDKTPINIKYFIKQLDIILKKFCYDKFTLKTIGRIPSNYFNFLVPSEGTTKNKKS